MKRAEEILKEYGDTHSRIQVMKIYGLQCAEQALKDAAENATILYFDSYLEQHKAIKYFQSGGDNITPNKQSILATEIKLP